MICYLLHEYNTETKTRTGRKMIFRFVPYTGTIPPKPSHADYISYYDSDPTRIYNYGYNNTATFVSDNPGDVFGTKLPEESASNYKACLNYQKAYLEVAGYEHYAIARNVPDEYGSVKYGISSPYVWQSNTNGRYWNMDTGGVYNSSGSLLDSAFSDSSGGWNSGRMFFLNTDTLTDGKITTDSKGYERDFVSVMGGGGWFPDYEISDDTPVVATQAEPYRDYQRFLGIMRLFANEEPLGTIYWNGDTSNDPWMRGQIDGQFHNHSSAYYWNGTDFEKWWTHP